MGPWRSTVMASLVSGSSLGSPTLSALTDPTALDALARDFSTEAPVFAAGLAHRVDQLRGLEQAAGDVEALGHETMDLLAPLADRLGMSRWRAALEDASFAVVAPVDHASLTAHLHADPVADQARPACPWLVVQGEEDELVDCRDVSEWTARTQPRPELMLMPDTDHLFHGRLTRLREVVTRFLLARAPACEVA